MLGVLLFHIYIILFFIWLKELRERSWGPNSFQGRSDLRASVPLFCERSEWKSKRAARAPEGVETRTFTRKSPGKVIACHNKKRVETVPPVR